MKQLADSVRGTLLHQSDKRNLGLIPLRMQLIDGWIGSDRVIIGLAIVTCSAVDDNLAIGTADDGVQQLEW